MDYLYKITVLTVSNTVTGGSNPPFPPYGGVRAGSAVVMTDPELQTLVIKDDDDRLDNGFYDMVGETDQKLVAPITIGGVTIPAGTQIGFNSGTQIRDAAGNRFVLMYPKGFAAGSVEGTDLGTGMQSMLVIPLKDPVTGLFPVFDPAGTAYTRVGSYLVGSDVQSIELQRGEAASPPPPPPPPPDPDPEPDPTPDPDDPDGEGPPCFTAGTLILTASGPVPVEALRPGDLVVTRDDGVQPLLWSGHRSLGPVGLDLAPNHRPIRIARGALGPGQPARDLVVSPQHRILLRSPIVERMFDAPEILVPARLLAGLPGIEVIRDSGRVTYWHLLFARHQVITSEGAWTESLLPGPMALRAFGPVAVAQIRARVTPEAVAPARPLPPARAIRSLVERHIRNPRRDLCEAEPQPAAPRALAESCTGR